MRKKWTKFGNLVSNFSGNSLKLMPPDALILGQNVPKCVWRPVSARTRWGSFSAPPDPLATKRGPTSKGRGKEGRGGEGKEREGRGSLLSRPTFQLVPTPLHLCGIIFFVAGYYYYYYYYY